MTAQCTDLDGDRAIGAYWERQFGIMAGELGKVFTPHQLHLTTKSASAYGLVSGRGWRHYLLPDVTIWSAPGEHHEIKHKRPTPDGCYGLELYRLDALAEFAETTGQGVYYTIHDWDSAGGRDQQANRLEDWRYADVTDISQRSTKSGRGMSWVHGRQKEVEIRYWTATRFFRPLAELWPQLIRLLRRREAVTVGHDLYREVVNFAPDDLSPGELVVAWVIADDARDSTRVSWITNAELCRRSRMKPSGVRAALGRLAARGLEFRAIHGYGKDGRPVFAAKGHAADYVVPDMLKGAVSAAPLAADGARKGAVVAHKGAVTAAPIGPKGAVVTAPLPSEDLNPLRQPSDDGPDLTPAVEGARASRQVNSSNVSEHERQHNALTRWEQSARGMTPIEAAAWNAIHPDGKQ